MKKIITLLMTVCLTVGAVAHQNSHDLDQFQWGMQNQISVLQKGMDYCEKNGFSFFKIEHVLIKTEEGRVLSFSDICHIEPDQRYEESTPLQSFILNCYREKPEESGVVDVKKHQLMKKLAMQARETSKEKFDELSCPSLVKDISDEDEFNQIIRNGTMPTFVKCYSPTCPPCQTISPLFESCAQEHADSVMFLKVDLNQLPHFREAYNIEKIPTLLIFDLEGHLVERKVGLMDVAHHIETYRESHSKE